jgi:hypothetical protein
MNNKEVEDLLDKGQADLARVDSIVNVIGQTSNPVPYLNKYSIIRACGTIEVAYKKLVSDFCKRKSKAQVKNFIDKKMLRDSRSPKYDNICNFLGEFDSNWHKTFVDEIKKHPDGAKIKTSLNSLSAERNDFAHGGNPIVTVADIVSYFAYSRIAIEILDRIVK